jgi:crotonobetainyl-CoA:carnitine CoA-transferase CaiB-like acyl-CoA transferase
MSRLNSFLDGIKVIDLTHYLPGPLATLLLADMGADVLKIEPPTGDEMRKQGPRDAEGHAIYFEAVNAGKTARVMNLKDPAERAAFVELARSADVLFEGFRPGVMRRLGLGYDTLSAVNPRLIYCSISGFGKSGPLAQRAGHDVNYLALGGVLHRNGAADPIYFDPPVGDCTSSLVALSAVLGALHARARDGKGCEIDLAIADAVMPFQVFALADLGCRDVVAAPRSTYLNGGAAYYQIYATRDRRHVALGAIEPKFWAAFCTAAGRPDWIARQADPPPQHALTAELARFFADLTLEDCTRRFEAADCCLTPVLDLREAMRQPHFRRRGLVHDAGAGGLQALFPALVDGEPPRPRARLRGPGAVEEAAS